MQLIGRRGLVRGALAGAVTAGCLGGRGARAEGPRLVVLGTAQDGGLPHAGCSCERCAQARARPALARRVACAAIVAEGQAWLIDATPDFPAQIEALAGPTGRPRGGVDRAPVAGILLTHAHVGHYLGLAWLGFEALHTRGLPVRASPRMAALLRTSAPWDQLVRLGNVALAELTPGVAEALVGGVTATPRRVPHRDEYTDTLGFVLAGPRVRALYVPDSAPWRDWSRPLPAVLAEEEIAVALIDGTFYSPDELPGRDLSTLAHPLMLESMDLLQPLVDAGRTRVIFTHLNHSNPALDPDSAAAREIRRRGYEVAEDGLEVSL